MVSSSPIPNKRSVWTTILSLLSSFHRSQVFFPKIKAGFIHGQSGRYGHFVYRDSASHEDDKVLAGFMPLNKTWVVGLTELPTMNRISD